MTHNTPVLAVIMHWAKTNKRSARSLTQKILNVLIILILLTPNSIVQSHNILEEKAPDNVVRSVPEELTSPYDNLELERPQARMGNRPEQTNGERISNAFEGGENIEKSAPEQITTPVPMDTPDLLPRKEDESENADGLGIDSIPQLDSMSPSNWVFNALAMYNSEEDYIRLTPDELGRSGSAWNTQKIDLTQPFDKSFGVYLGDKEIGADGMAFVLQNVGTHALGYYGGQLGYGGLQPSIEVEIDSYYNYEYNDPSNTLDHIGILEQGNATHSTLDVFAFPHNIENDNEHSFRIVWDPSSYKLSAYFDGIKRIEVTKDIVTDIFGGTTNVWWGFTGATCSLKNLHYFYEASILPEDRGRCNNDCDLTGQGNTQETVGDPINTRTGEFDYTNSDISFTTSAGDLEFFRTYSSLKSDTEWTYMGNGWTHNHDIRLILPGQPGGETGKIKFKGRSTNIYSFYEEIGGEYVPEPGFGATLSQLSGPPIQYQVVDPQQSVYLFDENGVLQSITNALGKIWAYQYDPSGRLIRINADGGARYLAIWYDDVLNKINRVEDHTGRFVTYAYSGNNLSGYSDLLGKTWYFLYDNPAFPHHLTEVQDPYAHPVLHVNYDTFGRAVQEYDGAGNLIVDLVYAPGMTTITNGLSQSTTHTYDGRNTFIGSMNSEASETGTGYDRNFRPLSITDENSNSTGLTWDSTGINLTNVVDAAGNQTDITYNTENNPTDVIDAGGFLTTYAYEDAEFPTLMTSSTNAYEQTTHYAYNDDGLLESIVEPLGTTTLFTYNSFGQVETESSVVDQDTQLTRTYTYDSLGRVKSVTDPEGRSNWTCYDAADRVIRTVNNASGDGSTPATDPCDAVNYVPSTDPGMDKISATLFDDAGRIIASIDTQGRITRTYYDAAGRVISVVQNLFNYDVANPIPPARNITDVLHNIRSDSRYDVAGNLIASIDPAGTVTRTYYDDLNRPEFVVQNLVIAGMDSEAAILLSDPPVYDPNHPDRNIRTQSVYDAAGNTIATIDPNGKITRTYYDSLNRPIYVAENLWDYLITNPTPPVYNPSYPDQNIVTRTVYDEKGNVIAAIDPLGQITRTYYDALDRPETVIENLIAYCDPEPFNCPAPSRGTPPSSTTNLRTDYVYDQNGNQIASIDPMGFVTRTYYDSINREVTTVRNLVFPGVTDVNVAIQQSQPPLFDPSYPDQNITTHTVYDEFGNAIATVSANPDPIISRTYRDEQGRVKATVQNLVGQPIESEVVPSEWSPPDGNIRSLSFYDDFGRQIAT